MINFYVTFIKPIITGQMLQLYAIVSGLFLLSLWTRYIVQHKRNTTLRPNGRKSLFIQLIIVLVFLCSIVGLVIPVPNLIKPSLPLFEPIEVTNTSPLVLVFDRPLGKKVVAQIVPDTPGEWKLETSTFSLPFNQLSFIPKDPLMADTEYLVEISDIAPLTGLNFFRNNRLLFSFKTPVKTDNPPRTQLEISRQLPTGNHIVEPTPTTQPTATPAQQTFVLKVPQYKQHHTFTCFSVAAKMALGFRGVAIDEVGFLDEIGYDKTERNFVSNTWGDPNTGVVGTYNGSGPGGYGVHWDPVATAMKKYRNVEVIRSWNIPDMLKKVEEGNPVMVWWVNGVWPAKDVSWNLPNGQKVYTVNGMHVEVVVGWTGDRNNPTNILTNDPWRGRRYYTPAQFNNLWKWFSNTGVVVY